MKERTLIDFTLPPLDPTAFAKPDPFDVANIRLQLEANRRKANQRDETRDLDTSRGR